MKKFFNLRTALVVIILVVITIPFLETVFHFADETELGGYFKELPEPELSVDTWFSGKYQLEKEKKIDESFGFRTTAIKINNQLAYSLFKKTNVADVIITKNNFIYEGRYIKSYYGQDFIGERAMRRIMKKVKFISDTLAKQNKTFILVFTPDKASYHPEYIPDNWKAVKERTNFDAYFEYCKKLGVDHINFYDYINNSKDKYKYPLFPQYGLHWSIYAATIAADSMVKYIEKKRSIDMPDLIWDKENVELADAKGMDYDLANGINLLYRQKSFKMAYPKLAFESDAGKTKPSTLIVGDSFYWPMYRMDLGKVFKDAQFWYYNEQINPGNGTTHEIDLEKEIARREVIIIVTSEATCTQLGWGFIDNLYDLYTNKERWSPERFKKELEDYRDYIKKNKEWMKGIEKRSVEAGISADSMLTNEAIWEVKMKMKHEKEAKEAEKNGNNKWSEEKIEEAVDKYRLGIKENKSWMKGLRKRALENNISVDSMVTLDAIGEVKKMMEENK